MNKLGVLALVLMILVAACQPAPAVTPTDLPTAIVTELPTGNEGAVGEATEEAGTTTGEVTEEATLATSEVTEEADMTTAEATEVVGAATEEATDEVALAPTTAMTAEATSEVGMAETAEVTGEPASSTAVSAVTGASTAEATADLAAMMPGNYCVEVTGLEGEPVVMQLNEGSYSYSFEGPAGEESATGSSPNVVQVGTHTLTFQDSDGRYQFILNFSDQLTLGTYQIGTAEMAELAGGPAPAEATDEAGAQATDEAGAVGTGAGVGAALSDQPIVLEAGTCADLMREAGMEATAEATDDMSEAETATPSGSAETVEPGAAMATATEVSATVVASGSDTEATAEATSEMGAGDEESVDTTPASPAEPTDNINLTTIGARLEPVGGAEGVSYTVLESGTLEIRQMEQQENVNVLSGALMLTLSSAEDTTSSVTVQGFFQNLPVNQTPR